MEVFTTARRFKKAADERNLSHCFTEKCRQKVGLIGYNKASLPLHVNATDSGCNAPHRENDAIIL